MSQDTNADEVRKVEVAHEGGENEVEINREIPAQGEQGKDGVDEAEEAKKEGGSNEVEEVA